MFLSKKNAIYFNKPKNIHQSNRKTKALAGWADGSDNEEQKVQSNQIQSETTTVPNLIEDFVDSTFVQAPKVEKRQNKQKSYWDWDALDQKQGIQCQKKLVQQIVQPGGIRIKPNENMLSQFLKQAKVMQVPIVSSLLLSKIQVNYPFPIKAKALYTIQYLVKKNQKYAAYFKHHFQKLQQFPEPQDNVENYKKILKGLLSTIGGSSSSIPSAQQSQTMEFFDPGYNEDSKKNDPISFIKSNEKKSKQIQGPKRTFVTPNEAKRKLVTPQTKNEQQNTGLMDIDLLGNSSNSNPKNNNDFNLLGDLGGVNSTEQPKQNILSYDQLFLGANQNKNQNSLF